MPMTAAWYVAGRLCIGDSLLCREPASSAAFCTAGLIVVVIVRPPRSYSSLLMPIAASSLLTCLMIMPTGLLSAEFFDWPEVGFLMFVGYFRAAYSAGVIQFIASMFFIVYSHRDLASGRL